MTKTDNPDNPKRHVHGNRPSHFHIFPGCPEGGVECNSPYCGEHLDSDPDELAPILQGREPWKR